MVWRYGSVLMVGWQLMRNSDKLTDNTQYKNIMSLILGMGFSTHRILKVTTDPKGSEEYLFLWNVISTSFNDTLS